MTPDPPAALLTALERLDVRLEAAVSAASAAWGRGPGDDPYRGLYATPGDATSLLARGPLGPSFVAPDASPIATSDEPPFALLAEAFGLDQFELDVVLLALAPELDLRYERIYAFLQDDVTRRRPTVDLALTLLCASPRQRLDRRTRFAVDAPLSRQRVVDLLPVGLSAPLLSHALALDGQIVRALIGDVGLDRRLAPFSELTIPDLAAVSWLPDDVDRSLTGSIGHAASGRRRVYLYFRGAPGMGQRRAAKTLASRASMALLEVDLRRLLASELEFGVAVELLIREAWLQRAVLFLSSVDGLRNDERGAEFEALVQALAAPSPITILSGSLPWEPNVGASSREPLGVVTVPFLVPDASVRRALWTEVPTRPSTRDVDALATRFRLGPDQISAAIAEASGRARWRAAGRATEGGRAGRNARPSRADFFAAARAQSSMDLGSLAISIEPVRTWEDIVLPDAVVTELRELCQWVVQRERVLGEWGFDRKLSNGKSATALFAGPSGTGKTLAAEVIAHELGLHLYKIDLAGVVSKYIGETEKNLDRIFRSAENANGILFFDEADALFGKRSEVRDSHDRYANIEISYLLQKMEAYDGLAILATNLLDNLDDALVRRLAFTVYFPVPEESERRRIWATVWPSEAPLAPDVDTEFLAREFRLNGGHVKNIALAAAYLAASDGSEITMGHVRHALRREYEKRGKDLLDGELIGPNGDGLHAGTWG